jgi:hypothetical protein
LIEIGGVYAAILHDRGLLKSGHVGILSARFFYTNI